MEKFKSILNMVTGKEVQRLIIQRLKDRHDIDLTPDDLNKIVRNYFLSHRDLAKKTEFHSKHAFFRYNRIGRSKFQRYIKDNLDKMIGKHK